MANEFKLEIVTPERVVFSDTVTSVDVQAVDGRLGIKYYHRPLVTELKRAPFSFVKDGEKQQVAISGGGYLEATPAKVTVLSNVAELDYEIDVDRANAAKQRAEERLAKNEEGINYKKAEVALKRALARLETAKRTDNG